MDTAKKLTESEQKIVDPSRTKFTREGEKVLVSNFAQHITTT